MKHPRFRMTAAMVHALRDAPIPAITMVASTGLALSRISGYSHGRPFGTQTRNRVLRLAELLGLPGGAAVREL